LFSNTVLTLPKGLKKGKEEIPEDTKKWIFVNITVEIKAKRFTLIPLLQTLVVFSPQIFTYSMQVNLPSIFREEIYCYN